MQDFGDDSENGESDFDEEIMEIGLKKRQKQDDEYGSDMDDYGQDEIDDSISEDKEVIQEKGKKKPNKKKRV